MNDPKFQLQQPVAIELMGLDTSFSPKAESLSLGMKVRRFDVGTGTVIERTYETDTCSWLYRISVDSGRFDGHRNDLGELWVNESELSALWDGNSKRLR